MSSAKSHRDRRREDRRPAAKDFFDNPEKTKEKKIHRDRSSKDYKDKVSSRDHKDKVSSRDYEDKVSSRESSSRDRHKEHKSSSRRSRS